MSPDDRAGEALRSAYLHRLETTVLELRRLLDELAVDPDGASAEIRARAHKMRGSGASYGYPDITHCAGAVEDAEVAALPARLEELLDVCESALSRDMRARALLLSLDTFERPARAGWELGPALAEATLDVLEASSLGEALTFLRTRIGVRVVVCDASLGGTEEEVEALLDSADPVPVLVVASAMSPRSEVPRRALLAESPTDVAAAALTVLEGRALDGRPEAHAFLSLESALQRIGFSVPGSRLCVAVVADSPSAMLADTLSERLQTLVAWWRPDQLAIVLVGSEDRARAALEEAMREIGPPNARPIAHVLPIAPGASAGMAIGRASASFVTPPVEETQDPSMSAPPSVGQSSGQTHLARPRRAPSGSWTLEVGDRIGGRYLIQRIIGTGSMGLVYEVLDPTLDRRVALKMVAPQEVASPQSRALFRTEARAMARVRHPNVVAIHDYGEHRGGPYFVMELVDGLDLREWLKTRERPLPIEQAMPILRDVAHAVAAIHGAGAMHGDLKPSNVLVDAGRFVVTDLGLARFLEGDEAKSLEPGGTPAYMAPEVIRRDRLPASLHHRVDVYSLAVLAFELLTGQRPFDAPGLVELLEMHTHREPPRPSTLRPPLGELGDAVLLGALQKDPLDRTASIDELLEGFEAMGAQAAAGGACAAVAIIDDDPDFTAFAAAALERALPGVQIQIFTDGAEAVSTLLEHPPDAALVDLQVPGASGFEIVAALRGGGAPRFPICVVTGVGGARDWNVMSAMGADAFILKPLDGDDLGGVMLRLLGGPRRPAVR